MFGRKCSSPGYGFVSGILLLFFFLAALSSNLHCGKTLGLEKSFEHGKVFQEYGWETRTFEEGKKKAPLIQGGGLRQAHTIEKVENPSSRLLKCWKSTWRHRPALKRNSQGKTLDPKPTVRHAPWSWRSRSTQGHTRPSWANKGAPARVRQGWSTGALSRTSWSVGNCSNFKKCATPHEPIINSWCQAWWVSLTIPFAKWTSWTQPGMADVPWVKQQVYDHWLKNTTIRYH